MQICNGEIKKAGINNRPKYLNLDGTLKPTSLPLWQQAAQKAQAIADDVYAPGSVGAVRVWTVELRVEAAKLPTNVKGKNSINFIPPKKYKASEPLKKGKKFGYLDHYKNEWIQGPSRTKGEVFEWDIQLSRAGKNKYGWASKDGKHINVSLKGKVTH